MTRTEIAEAVRRCGADTLVARAFRLAVGVPGPARKGRASARLDRYGEAESLMRQSYGVRM